VLLQPGKELACRAVVRKDVLDVTRGPPLLGEANRIGHRQWLRETARVRYDVNELGEHLGRNCQRIVGGHEPGQDRSRFRMTCVFDDFGGDQESCVHAVDH
jgi:hypothetical protein